jgi:signal transduction histidine kinase
MSQLSPAIPASVAPPGGKAPDSGAPGGGGQGGRGAGSAAPGGQRPRRRDLAGWKLALRNWRVPWRLIALIVIPTVMGLIFAGLRVAVATGNAVTFGRVEQLAVLGQDVTGLAQAMEDERDLTAGFIAAGRPAGSLTALRKQYAVTDSWAAKVRALAEGVGAAFPAQTRTNAAAVLARIADLPDLRSSAAQGQSPALIVITNYSQATADLFSFNDDIAQGGGNAALVASVRALGSLSRMKDQASQQRAILDTALTQGRFPPGALTALIAAQAQQASNLAAFQTSATLTERQGLDNTVAGPQVDRAQAVEQRAAVLGSSGSPMSLSATGAQWYADMSYTVGRMRLVEQQLTGSILAQAQALRKGAGRSALLTGFAALAVLIFVLLATLIIARSMVRPLRLLKEGAFDVAEVRLPGEVRELTKLGAADQGLDVEPIGVHSTDEIGQVARAFDQVHREAVRLAGDEAKLRSSVSAMFVSLSRRSQSLLERLLRLIDSLELGEEDPERLANLFRMDHLATRMRRNSENLLVLAGHETPRRWAEPVSLVDVVRASVSEIEQYDRVVLNIQPGVAITGNAVADTVHLLAELLENATMFSAKSTQVTVSGHTLGSGEALIDIADNGMGMSDEQLAQVNTRLENPPTADVEVSRHMGLFAVAHLAARHRIRVRLQKATAGGLAVQVWIPSTLTSQDSGPAADSRHAAARASTRVQAVTRSTRFPLPRAAAASVTASSPVIVPEAEGAESGPPLPIFDSVESDWFRARGRRLQRRGAAPLDSGAARPWRSPGDDGWRAAEAVLAPSVGGMTTAGLPRRVPKANLVPGSAGEQVVLAATPAEPAEVARDRLAGFQRGSRRARAAAPAREVPDA